MRKLLALALLVLAGTLPADADILTQQQLETMVRAQPDLSMKLIGGRQYVSVKGDGDGLGYIDAATIERKPLMPMTSGLRSCRMAARQAA